MQVKAQARVNELTAELQRAKAASADAEQKQHALEAGFAAQKRVHDQLLRRAQVGCQAHANCHNCFALHCRLLTNFPRKLPIPTYCSWQLLFLTMLNKDKNQVSAGQWQSGCSPG